MNPKTITAWDALNRTNQSRRSKSVGPAMEKIHVMILEATDAERTSVDIGGIIRDSNIATGIMIKDALKALGYEIQQPQGITGPCMVQWENATAPRYIGGRD